MIILRNQNISEKATILPFSYIFILVILVALIPMSVFGKTEHTTHFEKTDYELHVYKINGVEDGKTLMIIGGIQGDEPGGYLAADLYVDMALQKGNIIVVPRANFLSIMKNKRSINGDMNRRFVTKKSRDYEDKVVFILKDLIAQSDYLLNLHDGSGFYSPKWESPMINPNRFGQSIISDVSEYTTPDGTELHLGHMARRVAEKVNDKIKIHRHRFQFNNHRTFEGDTQHPEQRMSATYFALSKHHIPAFGVETSKEIKSLEQKVRYQSMIINGFLDEFGIIPENPKIDLNPPKLHYIVVSVNGTHVLAHSNDKVKIRKGDRIKIDRIEANYNRGLSIDLIGIGAANDLNKEFVIKKSVKAILRKDGFKFAEIPITISNTSEALLSSVVAPKFKYLILELNDKKHVVENGEHLNVVRGDLIQLLDVVVDGAQQKELTVNFRGFVGNRVHNSGEDRGYIIDTAKGLWVKYSKGKRGKNYTISISKGEEQIGTVYVDIEEPTEKIASITEKRSSFGNK